MIRKRTNPGEISLAAEQQSRVFGARSVSRQSVQVVHLVWVVGRSAVWKLRNREWKKSLSVKYNRANNKNRCRCLFAVCLRSFFFFGPLPSQPLLFLGECNLIFPCSQAGRQNLRSFPKPESYRCQPGELQSEWYCAAAAADISVFRVVQFLYSRWHPEGWVAHGYHIGYKKLHAFTFPMFKATHFGRTFAGRSFIVVCVGQWPFSINLL